MPSSRRLSISAPVVADVLGEQVIADHADGNLFDAGWIILQLLGVANLDLEQVVAARNDGVLVGRRPRAVDDGQAVDTCGLQILERKLRVRVVAEHRREGNDRAGGL